MDFLIGFLLSLIIAALAYKKNSLNFSGLIAATIIGTLIYVTGTYIMFVLLILFFISSSIITKFKNEDKREKLGRNYIQVIANSFAALVFSIIYFVTKETTFLVVSAIAIASSTADTWASEIGKISKGKIISIVNFKQVPKGESGGISLLGTSASLLGSLMIAGIFVTLMGFKESFNIDLLYYLLIITIAGFVGCVLDSYLGIFIQAKYIELSTGLKTEFKNNKKGLRLVSGIPFINNDMVNLLSTVCVAVIFAIILF